MLVKGIENTCVHILDKLVKPNTENGGIITFLHKNMVVLIFVDAKREYIEKLIQILCENLMIFIECDISMCVGKLNDTIYNLSGSLQMKGEAVSGRPVDVSILPAGVYMVETNDRSGGIEFTKVLKNN